MHLPLHVFPVQVKFLISPVLAFYIHNFYVIFQVANRDIKEHSGNKEDFWASTFEIMALP